MPTPRTITRKATSLAAITSVLLAGVYTTPVHAADADGDGLADNLDLFPCDAQLASEQFLPAEGATSSIFFEDQWPFDSDTDFNDLVLAWNERILRRADNSLVSITLTVDILAIGAKDGNGIGLHLPIARNKLQNATLSIAGSNGGAAQPISARLDENNVVLQIIDNARQAYAPEGVLSEELVNADQTANTRATKRLVIQLDFAAGTVFTASSIPDLFLYKTASFAHQIHLPQFSGTETVDTRLFGQGRDGTGGNRFFVDTNGLPYALAVPTTSHYPREKTPISQLFPDIVTFAATGGAQQNDFFNRPVVANAMTNRPAGVNAPSFADPNISCVLGQSPSNAGTSCQALKNQDASLADGNYFIDPDGGGSVPAFQIFCLMSASPAKEYITLAAQDSNSNFSFYSGAISPHGCGTIANVGGGARTQFQKIRLLPTTMTIDVADTTFSTTSGSTTINACANPSVHFPQTVQRVASANDCHSSGSARGQANLNLTGTSFIIAAGSAWAGSGFNPGGGATFTIDRKRVNITGGGHCAGVVPTTIKIGVQ